MDNYEDNLWKQLWASIRKGFQKEGDKEKLGLVWVAFGQLRERAGLLKASRGVESLASQMLANQGKILSSQTAT